MVTDVEIKSSSTQGNEKPTLRVSCDGCEQEKDCSLWQESHYRLCVGCAVKWTAQSNWRGFDDEVV